MDETQAAPETTGLQITERVLGPGESLLPPESIARASVVMIDLDDESDDHLSQATHEAVDVDGVIAAYRDYFAQHIPDATRGVMTRRRANAIAKRQLAQGPLDIPMGAEIVMAAPPRSRQVTIEDLQKVWNYVPLPGNVDLTIFEQRIFQENHIAGEILSRTSKAVTKRGTEMKQYNPDDPEEETSEVRDEIARLWQFRDNLFSHRSFNNGVQNSNALFHSTGNLYWEVIPDAYGPQGRPKQIDYAISSTMRVIQGHKGYVQVVGNKLVWYNNYLASVEDRVKGEQVWRDFWANKGVNVDDPDFRESPWVATLSSDMPEGVWNPNLTSIIHFADISLSSKYYGFPRDYRIQKIHALLQFALDWNISVQRNGSAPYVLVFYGQLDDNSKSEIKAYLRSFRGAKGAGQIPIIDAPATAGAGQSPGSKQQAGLERITIGVENTEGVFLDLVRMCVDHLAMHYRYPIDALLSDNSNRSTMVGAMPWFESQVVQDDHSRFEEKLRLICADAGFTHRYIGFVSLNLEERLTQSQIASGYLDRGVLNPDEVRTKMLGLPARPGGEQYMRPMNAVLEDELAEEQATRAAQDMLKSAGIAPSQLGTRGDRTTTGVNADSSQG